MPYFHSVHISVGVEPIDRMHSALSKCRISNSVTPAGRVVPNRRPDSRKVSGASTIIMVHLRDNLVHSRDNRANRRMSYSSVRRRITHEERCI